MPKKSSSVRSSQRLGDRPLVAWGERRPDPDWDRYLAVLIALALRRIEEAAAEEDDPGGTP